MKIVMRGDNIFAKKVKTEVATEFEIPESANSVGAKYTIVHAPEDCEIKEGDVVLLAPGDYLSEEVNGEVLLHLHETDVIAYAKD